MPVDAAPNPDGNLTMTPGSGPGAPLVEVVNLFTDPEAVRYMPHHATCPNVEEFRGKARETNS